MPHCHLVYIHIQVLPLHKPCSLVALFCTCPRGLPGPQGRKASRFSFRASKGRSQVLSKCPYHTILRNPHWNGLFNASRSNQLGYSIYRMFIVLHVWFCNGTSFMCYAVDYELHRSLTGKRNLIFDWLSHRNYYLYFSYNQHEDPSEEWLQLLDSLSLSAKGEHYTETQPEYNRVLRTVRNARFYVLKRTIARTSWMHGLGWLRVPFGAMNLGQSRALQLYIYVIQVRQPNSPNKTQQWRICPIISPMPEPLRYTCPSFIRICGRQQEIATNTDFFSTSIYGCLLVVLQREGGRTDGRTMHTLNVCSKYTYACIPSLTIKQEVFVSFLLCSTNDIFPNPGPGVM